MTDDQWERLGELVTARMAWLGVSQAQTAEAVDVSDAVIRSVERGQGARHRPATVARLMRGLNWPWTPAELTQGQVGEREAVQERPPAWALESTKLQMNRLGLDLDDERLDDLVAEDHAAAAGELVADLDDDDRELALNFLRQLRDRGRARRQV